MSDRFIEMFGLYGGVIVLAFVSGMFPLVSIEAFLIAWCSLRDVTWPEFATLMVLAALPFVLFGALFLAAPVDTLAQQVLASPNLQQAGATEALVVSAVRIFGGAMLAVAVP